MATSANKLRKEKRECIVLSGAEQGEISTGESWTRGVTAGQAGMLTPGPTDTGSFGRITEAGASLHSSLGVRKLLPPWLAFYELQRRKLPSSKNYVYLIPK